MECAWVPGNAVLPFEGGHQFADLPVLRRRGKQKEKDYKYTVKLKFSHVVVIKQVGKRTNNTNSIIPLIVDT